MPHVYDVGQTLGSLDQLRWKSAVSAVETRLCDGGEEEKEIRDFVNKNTIIRTDMIHYTTPQYHSIVFYSILHCVALRCVALRCVALR